MAKNNSTDNSTKEVVKTKKIRNIASNKREIIVDGKLVSLLPNEVVEVPDTFAIPTGLGIQEV